MSPASSSTPPSLTPQTTGPQEAHSESTSTKKSRRGASFYPHNNASTKPQKPFSRSAAKRESVMALGSIEHLQHYFTKTGIQAKKDSQSSQRKGLVPAIGGLQHIRANSSLTSIQDFELPPSPIVPMPNQPAFPPYVKTYETDAQTLKPSVIEDLVSVERAWRLSTEAEPEHDPSLLAPSASSSRSGPNVDILDLLKTTTHAIRSVRNYQVSLPDEDEVTTVREHQFRPKSLSANMSAPRRLVSQPNDPNDPQTLIRRTALEVLTALRTLEESSRVPLSDDAYDAQSDRGSSHGDSQGRVASPESDEHEHAHDSSFAFSVVEVKGRHNSVLVWEDDDVDFNQLTEEEKRERWDERVLAGGWLYKQDVKWDDVAKEREVVGRYLDYVDRILFGGPKGNERGWAREMSAIVEREKKDKDGRFKGRRASHSPGRIERKDPGGPRRHSAMGLIDTSPSFTFSEEPQEMQSVREEDEEGEDEEAEDVGSTVSDSDLPDWAKRTTFPNPSSPSYPSLARAHALLVSLLPTTLLVSLPRTADDRSEFLQSLTTGQLLCVAYNVGVRRSRKPWGFISKDSIHDILALEEQAIAADGQGKGRKGWTFRRTDNLRLWAAALKLRYSLPIVGPAPPNLPLPPAPLMKKSSTSSLNSTSGPLIKKSSTSSLNSTAPLPSISISTENIVASHTTASNGTPIGSATGTPVASPSPSSIQFPSTPPKGSRSKDAEQPIYFDAKIVARMEENWEEMLETVLLRWIKAVVDERRIQS